jgi:DNA-binding IclR family transcriptional regulator
MANKEIIEGLLKDSPQGLTIQDLADKTKLARNTVKIILAQLQGENKIEIREVGQAKLHYWRSKCK